MFYCSFLEVNVNFRRNCILLQLSYCFIFRNSIQLQNIFPLFPRFEKQIAITTSPRINVLNCQIEIVKSIETICWNSCGSNRCFLGKGVNVIYAAILLFQNRLWKYRRLFIACDNRELYWFSIRQKFPFSRLHQKP